MATLPKPERHRSGSASKPCVTVSKSHGSSITWRLSTAPLQRSASLAVLQSWQWRWSSCRLCRPDVPPRWRGIRWSTSH